MSEDCNACGQHFFNLNCDCLLYILVLPRLHSTNLDVAESKHHLGQSVALASGEVQHTIALAVEKCCVPSCSVLEYPNWPV